MNVYRWVRDIAERTSLARIGRQPKRNDILCGRIALYPLRRTTTVHLPSMRAVS